MLFSFQKLLHCCEHIFIDQTFAVLLNFVASHSCTVVYIGAMNQHPNTQTFKLIKVLKVQECDAIVDATSTTAWLIKIPEKNLRVIIYYAAFVLKRALRGNKTSVTKINNKLIAVVAATLPMKKIKSPNCNHSISTRHALCMKVSMST